MLSQVFQISRKQGDRKSILLLSPDGAAPVYGVLCRESHLLTVGDGN